MNIPNKIDNRELIEEATKKLETKISKHRNLKQLKENK